jgi:hypothetical protein
MVAAHDVSGPPLATAAATSMVGAGLSPDVAVLQQTGLGDAIIPLDSSVDLAAALGLQALSRAETHGLDSGGLMLGFVTDALRAGLTYKHDRLTPVDPAFTRELLDLDGEGQFPFSQERRDVCRREDRQRGRRPSSARRFVA